MKHYIIIIAALLTAGTAKTFAQGVDTNKYGPNAEECMKYLSYYDEYYKQKNYTEAIPYWQKAYKLCPVSASKNMIIRGPKLVGMMIAKTTNPEHKKALVDTLMMLYTQNIELKPDQAIQIRNNMGIDVNKYYTDSKERFQAFEEIIAGNQEQTKSTFFSYDLDAAIKEYNNGNLGADEVIDVFSRNIELASKYVPSGQMDSIQVAKVKKDLSSMLVASDVASCDKVIEIFQKQLDADPNNEALVTRIVKIMNSVPDCQSNDFYLGAIETLNKLNPEAISSYTMFRIRASKDDVNGAIEYLKKAIEDNPTNDSYVFDMANYCYSNGRNVEAVEYANKASKSPVFGGKAYMLLGSVWGSLNCGGDEFTAYTHFWVAYDYIAKAKKADPSLEEDANRLMSTFASRFPKTTDAFMYNVKDGETYTVNCAGMKASTIVRTNK